MFQPCNNINTSTVQTKLHIMISPSLTVGANNCNRNILIEENRVVFYSKAVMTTLHFNHSIINCQSNFVNSLRLFQLYELTVNWVSIVPVPRRNCLDCLFIFQRIEYSDILCEQILNRYFIFNPFKSKLLRQVQTLIQ